ncbi:hypothetical protein SLEP1_g27962 [Rubroshorea leprosula]|uniref:Uncharacterized protein n=1 Tax=Rubroshorea leprosula TaxID=152421 RepID=A0AAV5JXM0_9ROSI|nr:hypothetical protein SLEP1_g27962 [Rubroshorea leprosula]
MKERKVYCSVQWLKESAVTLFDEGEATGYQQWWLRIDADLVCHCCSIPIVALFDEGICSVTVALFLSLLRLVNKCCCCSVEEAKEDEPRRLSKELLTVVVKSREVGGGKRQGSILFLSFLLLSIFNSA